MALKNISDKALMQSLDIDYGKMPPQAVDIEEAILGALILESDAFVKIGTFLKAECFYKEAHNKIYQVIEELAIRGDMVDILTTTEELRKKGELDEVGGPYYITQLTSRVVGSGHIIYHARIIYQKWLAREVIRITSEGQKKAFDVSKDINDIIDWMNNEIHSLENISGIKSKSMKQAVDNTIQDIANKQAGRVLPQLKVESENFKRSFDLSSNNIIFIAALPKSGKTKLVINLVYEIMLSNNNVSVCWFSMEDPHDKLVRNLISIITGYTDDHMQSKNDKKITQSDFESIIQATNIFESWDIEIHDEQVTIDRAGLIFSSFCKTRPNNFCIFIYDNFNIGRDLIKGSKMTDTEKDNQVASEIQRINNRNNSLEQQSITIVVDHLNKSQFSRDALKDGYRPRTEFLTGSGRKYQVLTQLFLFNRPGLYYDLLAEEDQKPHIIINGKEFKRRAILEELTIGQLVANRNGTIKESATLSRWLVDLGRMDMREWTTKVSSKIATKSYVETDRLSVKEDVFMKELFSIHPEGDPSMAYVTVCSTLGQRTADGKILTFDYLVYKFKEYFNNKIKKQNDNPQYTPKQDRLVNIETYLDNKMYNQTFKDTVFGNELTRDKYLYNIE